MQPRRIRQTDINPRLDRAGEIAHRNRRLVGVGQPRRERDPLAELAGVREYPRDQELLGFGRVARDAERQRFVDLAVGVGEIDVDGVDGRGQPQVSISSRRPTMIDGNSR